MVAGGVSRPSLNLIAAEPAIGMLAGVAKAFGQGIGFGPGLTVLSVVF